MEGHRIFLSMARLNVANAISCLSSFLVDQGKCSLQAQQKSQLKSIKELTPDEQETTLASRNRLQDLPEWLEEFTENLVESKSTSSGSDSRDPQEPPRSGPLPAQAPKGKHNLFTHVPKDPNCEAYESYESSLQTKYTKSHIPRDHGRRNYYSQRNLSEKKNSVGQKKSQSSTMRGS